MEKTKKPRATVRIIVVLLVAILWLTAFAVVFFVAPRERVMGIVQKIFYFHVPFAIAMTTMFLLCSVASLVDLIRPDDRADAFAATAAELAVVFGVIALVSGPLWGRKAWGTYWTWEPRLTLTLLSVFMFAGYLALRSFGGDSELTRRGAAGLGMMGGPAYYFIKVAVERWGGNHPKDVVYGKSEGLENADMALAFFLSLAAVAAFACVVFWLRYAARRLRQQVDTLVMEMGEHALLEEEM